MGVMAAGPFVVGAAVAASVGAGIGGFAAARAVAGTGASGSSGADVALFACPEPGAGAIGSASVGDRLWVVGRTDDRWAVVLLPDDPSRTGWLPLGAVGVDGDPSLLPELDCGSPEPAAAGATPSSAPTTSLPSTTPSTSPPTTTTASSAPPSSAPPSTTTASSAPVTSAPTAVATVVSTTSTTVGAATTTATTATTIATTTTSASTTVATTTSTTVTTIVPDTTPPGAVLTPDRTSFYDVNGDPGCVDVLFVTVSPADDRPGATVTGVTARWAGQAGPAEVALAADAGRYRLEVFSNPPPTSAVVTIAASVRDAAGNMGAGTTTVSLLNAGANGCVVG